MKQKQKFDETLYADVEYLDDKGNFDFKKFADAASASKKIKNKDKAVENLQQIQEKWKQQRQAIRDEKLEVKERPIPVNNKQQQIIDEVKKKQQKLNDLIKNSKKIDEEILNNKQQNKKLPVVKKIDREIEKLSADEARVRLFRFEQMEKVI